MARGALGARTFPLALTHTSDLATADSYIVQLQHLLGYSNLQVWCLTQLTNTSKISGKNWYLTSEHVYTQQKGVLNQHTRTQLNRHGQNLVYALRMHILSTPYQHLTYATDFMWSQGCL